MYIGLAELELVMRGESQKWKGMVIDFCNVC